MEDLDANIRATTMELIGAYQLLLLERRWDEWIDLWAPDAELHFPFAPLGRQAVYRGRDEIVRYMSAVDRVVVDSVTTFELHAMQDPNAAVVEFTGAGHAAQTGAPFNQSYVIFVHARNGKIWRYREYWNPLVSIDALGDHQTWSEGFGSPEPNRNAWGA